MHICPDNLVVAPQLMPERSGDVTITTRAGAVRAFPAAQTAYWRADPWRLVIVDRGGNTVVFLRGVIESLEISAHVEG